MVKSIFLHGLIAGVLSGVAGAIYQMIYQEMYFVDFSPVVNLTAIMASSIIGCMLMAVGYFCLFKIKKMNLIGWLNIIYTLLAFISILPAMAATLPLDVEFPEIFPGMVVPMHFFPAVAFFALSPFFINQSTKVV